MTHVSLRSSVFGAVAAAGLALGLSGAQAASYSYDFENVPGGTGGLEAYLNAPLPTTVGRGGVNVDNAQWFDNSGVFGSDVVYTTSGSTVFDFDTNASGASTWAITGLELRWGVFDSTSGVDWGLDVYADGLGYIDNVFTVSGVSDGSSGLSGFIDLTGYGAITRIRFHDSGVFDVALDDLTIYDNVSAVPLPAAFPLFAAGVAGIGALGRLRRRRKDAA